MEKRTYKDWKSRGFQVVKGSKAVARNGAGEALFQSDQVKESYVPDEGDAESMMEEYDFYNYDGYFDNIGDR